MGDGYKVDPSNVLEAAKDHLLTVCVIGLDKDGQLYVAGSDGAEASYFIMARAQQYLLDHAVGRS